MNALALPPDIATRVRHGEPMSKHTSWHVGGPADLYFRPLDVDDAFEWYCPKCWTRIHRIEVNVQDIVKDLPPLFEAFYAGDRRCPACDCCTLSTLKRGSSQKVMACTA